MVPNLRLCGVMVLLAAIAAFGCHKSAVQQKPPPDPLLKSVQTSSKKPVEGKPQSLIREPGDQTYPLPPDLPEASSATTKKEAAPTARTVRLPQ